MGKHKTKIERIVNAKNRHLAFYKRKKGLLKKAMELSIMCDVHIFMCIFNTNAKKCAEFTTLNLQKLIDMYNNIPRKDVSVFAPAIELDKHDKTQKITPLEWNASTKEKLTKSAETIKKTKVASIDKAADKKRTAKGNNKSDENSKSEMDASEITSKSKFSKSIKPGGRRAKRRKTSESDDDSDNDNSAMDEDFDSVDDSEYKSKDLNEGPNQSVSHLNDPSSFGKIVLTSTDNSNQIKRSKSNSNNVKKEQDVGYSKDAEMVSPGFKNSKESNQEYHQNKEEQKSVAGYPKSYDFKGVISPMPQGENSPNKTQLGFIRKDSAHNLENLNHQSRNDDNHSFTFDHNNPHTSSMKSPGSITHFQNVKKEPDMSSPFGLKMEKLQHQISSPNLLFGSLQNTTKNGKPDFAKSPIGAFEAGTAPDKDKTKKDSSLMKMLDEIGDLEESFAATKAAIKGKATNLEQGETEKKKRRKQKLKMKGKDLKVSIPSSNKFLADSAAAPKDEKQSPFRKIYTPTPTKKLINMNMSDNGGDPLLWFNQLSNKGNGPPKMNMESPFMLLQESRCNPIYLDQKFGTPQRFMSPTSQYANPDFLKFHQSQLSNGYYVPENRDNSYFNASPYLMRPVVSKNYNYNNININNHYNKDADKADNNNKKL